ncbi:hypothetical protein ACRZ3H_003495, partial [Yersinia ruckeri]
MLVTNAIVSSNTLYMLTGQDHLNATRTPSPKVKRERLDYAAFCKIYEAAGQQQNWVQLSLALALITGQRR